MSLKYEPASEPLHISVVAEATLSLQDAWTPEDLKVADRSEEKDRKLFDTLDTNGDGSVSYEEFLAGLKRLNIAPLESSAASAASSAESSAPKNTA